MGHPVALLPTPVSFARRQRPKQDALGEAVVLHAHHETREAQPPVLDAVESSPMRERRIATSKVCAHLARLLARNSLQASPFTAWSGNVWRVHEGNEAQQVESVNQNQNVTSIFGLTASMQHVAFRTNKLPAVLLIRLKNLLLVSAVLKFKGSPLACQDNTC